METIKAGPRFFSFAGGFAVATILGLAFVLPQTRNAQRVNIDSDVHRGLSAALDDIEQNAARGDCARTAAQLRLLNARFLTYREGGGPPPADWWQEVIATMRPAT